MNEDPRPVIQTHAMKTKSCSLLRTSGFAALAAVSLLAFAPPAEARDHKDRHSDRRSSSFFRSWFGSRSSHHHHDHDDVRRRYFAYPRSSFTLSFGTGYAGRGYYYGPPGMPYYYQGPGVVYYSRREYVPRQYWGSPAYRNHYGVEADVQRELARRGYYYGPIDGDIGPGSRSAIARYQRDRGLYPSGRIDSNLLRSLGL